MSNIEKLLKPVDRRVNTLKVIVFCAILGLSGCTANIASTYYSDAPKFDRRPIAHQIDVYLLDNAPAGLQNALPVSEPLSAVPPDATALGRLDVRGTSNWKTSLSAATDQANRWGGDAIVIDEAERKKYISAITFGFSAEVIRYLDDAEQISDLEDEQETGGD